MTDKQPAQFDWATELSDTQGHVTLSKQEAKEIGAKLKAYEDLGWTTAQAYDVAQAGIDAVRQWANQPKDTK